MSGRVAKCKLFYCAAVSAVVVLHLLSLCVLVRFYGSSCVVEYGQGFAIVYWGGEKKFRDNFIYNAGEWPLSPETHFGGGYLPDGQRWETYGPGLELDPHWFSERIKYRGLLRALGFSLPQRRGGVPGKGSQEDAASLLIPLGTAALVMGCVASLSLLNPNKLVQRMRDSRCCSQLGRHWSRTARDRLFHTLTDIERQRLVDLTKDMRIVQDVIHAFGEPDIRQPVGLVVTKPEKDGNPEATQSYPVMVYTKLSKTADVRVTIYPMDRVGIGFMTKGKKHVA
jgi:hypothetical protein